jgi:hypothetical protein
MRRKHRRKALGGSQDATAICGKDGRTEVTKTVPSNETQIRGKHRQKHRRKALGGSQDATAIAFPRLVSRLYVGLLVACSEGNSKHLHVVSQMLPAVAHPLRAFLLCYTASTLLPKESERYLSFTVENLKQMLELLPRFKELYPDAMQSANGWLTANVSFRC